MSKRARRRSHVVRMKKRALKLCERYYGRENAVKYANHLKVCSCGMCGNPRKFAGEKTLQERKFEESC